MMESFKLGKEVSPMEEIIDVIVGGKLEAK